MVSIPPALPLDRHRRRPQHRRRAQRYYGEARAHSMIATTESDIQHLRKAGELLGSILHMIGTMARPGVSSATLDLEAERLIRAQGAVPAFLGYTPEGARSPYPATLCVSFNDEVVHGIPTQERVLKEGDLVMLDLGLSYNGLFSDAAITLCVGGCDAKTKKLLDAVKEALGAAIDAAQVGGHIGDIGAAITSVARKRGFAVVDALGGHALGKVPHEKPFVPNVARAGTGEKLVAGMVLAIEPIFTEGKSDVYLAEDEWTYKTVDGSRSAEFEHTILLTDDGPEILTLS